MLKYKYLYQEGKGKQLLMQNSYLMQIRDQTIQIDVLRKKLKDNLVREATKTKVRTLSKMALGYVRRFFATNDIFTHLMKYSHSGNIEVRCILCKGPKENHVKLILIFFLALALLRILLSQRWHIHTRSDVKFVKINIIYCEQ